MAERNQLAGTKFLIAAGACAGTVAGWILLSLTGAPAGGAGNTSGRDPALEELVRRPLPTLAVPGVSANPSGAGLPAVSGAAPTALPTLRSVDLPPAGGPAAPPPVTNTQSSR